MGTTESRSRAREPTGTDQPGEEMLRALERDAEQVAEQALRRRQAAFASLPASDRETLATVAHRVAAELAACLAAEARRDERLARALRDR